MNAKEYGDWYQLWLAATRLSECTENPRPDDEQWLSWVAGCVNAVKAAADKVLPDEDES